MNLLIVDDNREILELIADIFEEDTQKIWCASNGAEALKLMERFPEIDSVVSDVEMPVMDGISLCQRIKHTWPQIPVYIVTSEVRARGPALNAGAEDVILKPFGIEELRLSVLCSHLMRQLVV